jgi:choline dehydrogenase-like flavoprotein
VQSEQIPLFKSKIKVSSSKNKFTNKLLNVDIDWQIDGKEFEYINIFLGSVNKYLLKHKIAYLKSYQINNFSNIRDTNHPSGGTIISSNKYNGVVDSNLKIWGTNNIYVASSSVFPKNSFANNTLTILAFSLRLSKYLKKNRNII